MRRDRRLTGYLRGQADNPTAPPGFELNSPWQVSAAPSYTYALKAEIFRRNTDDDLVRLGSLQWCLNAL